MYQLNLFSENKDNLKDFLEKYYNSSIKLDELKFEKDFENDN